LILLPGEVLLTYSKRSGFKGLRYFVKLGGRFELRREELPFLFKFVILPKLLIYLDLVSRDWSNVLLLLVVDCELIDLVEPIIDSFDLLFLPFILIEQLNLLQFLDGSLLLGDDHFVSTAFLGQLWLHWNLFRLLLDCSHHLEESIVLRFGGAGVQHLHHLVEIVRCSEVVEVKVELPVRYLGPILFKIKLSELF